MLRGGIAPLWESGKFPEEVSRDMGYRSDSIAVLRGTLSFHSLVFRISLVNFKQGISLVILVSSLSFPRILWARQRKSLVNLRFFLGKTEKARNGRTGYGATKSKRKLQVNLFLKAVLHGPVTATNSGLRICKRNHLEPPRAKNGARSRTSMTIPASS